MSKPAHSAPPSSTSTSSRRALWLAGIGLLVTTALAFAAAYWTREAALFSLQPPGGGAADFAAAQRHDLHRTFFTIWAALLLAAPALAYFVSRHRSPRHYQLWRAFWTASLLVFAVHFYWAVVVMFGNDWSRILSTPRVSAPRLDTVFAVWWCIDVLLAWTLQREPWPVRVQRWLVHILAFILFFMGAAREGELVLSRVLGWGFAAVVGVAVAGEIWRRWGDRKAGS